MSSIISRIKHHIADPESHHRKIAVGFVWISLFVFVGKLAGAAKEMAIAWRYGVSEKVDAYVFVFNLINWPVSVWFGVLTVVLVPLVARIRNDSLNELTRFRGELLGLTLIVGAGLGLLAWLGLPLIMTVRRVGLSDQALAEALNMASGLWMLAPISALISLFSALMLASGRHRNTLFEAIPALTILSALLLPSNWVSEPLLWGTVAGFALHMTALAVPLQRVGGMQAPSFEFNSPAWHGFWSSVGIMAVGQALMSFATIIDQFLAAGLGTGALSTLSYANRIMALILGMGAMAIGRATLPVFSEASTRVDTRVNALGLRWAKWMLILGLGVFAVGWVAAPWAVSLLFERGAFTVQDTAHVSVIFRYALVQVPFYAFSLTLVNLMASQRRYGTLLVSGVVGICTKIGAAAMLVPLMQLEGLVLSTTFVYAANAMLFYYFTNKAMK
jgi:putative peptidoglycan lipid II flippase